MRIFKRKDAVVVLAIGGALIAGPVGAFQRTDLVCLFETECYDAADCAATERRITVEPAEAPRGAVLTDGAETIPALVIESDGTLAFLGDANGALRLLTGIEGEMARMSIHNAAGDLMLNYTGICEGAD
ncbi:hypothetical protein [Palleronia sp.]|uniref:hypothetical protein n=1 Tax=Palleronia sp. TaxID=1940284 RepID=UPI0035C81D08